MKELGPEPRLQCPRCWRPSALCWCRHITPLETGTRVVILQHPRERPVAVGTARMAHLALTGSLLRVGVEFADDEVVRRILAERPYLLYPADDAIAIEDIPAERKPITLVVVDGTWSQAHSILRRNPALQALPKLRLRPAAPSRYRIRAEPAEHCVSTVEAMAQVLGALEGDPEKFQALLRPFDAMVEGQLHFAREIHDRRRRTRPPRPPAPRTLGQVNALRAAAGRLLLVHGEANAWPVSMANRPDPELVHWLAFRPSTGERFEALIAPRSGLSPTTGEHLRLEDAHLAAGEPLDAFIDRWRAFLRPDDLPCAWGTYPLQLLAATGVLLPGAVNVRGVAAEAWLRRDGTVEIAVERLGLAPVAPLGRGRGGRRLGGLAAVVARLLTPGSEIVGVPEPRAQG